MKADMELKRQNWLQACCSFYSQFLQFVGLLKNKIKGGNGREKKNSSGLTENMIKKVKERQKQSDGVLQGGSGALGRYEPCL